MLEENKIEEKASISGGRIEETNLEDTSCEFAFRNNNLSSRQVLHNIDLILASDLSFADITPPEATSQIFNFETVQNITTAVENKNLLRSECNLLEMQNDKDSSQNTIFYPNQKFNIHPSTASLLLEENEGHLSDHKSCLGMDSILRSRHSSLHTNETDIDDSFYTIHGTISNTESFSELRFSMSDSDSWTSQEKPKNVGQKISFHNIPDYYQNSFDDTTGILYEMSEQINKVPKYMSGLTRSPDHISENSTLLRQDESSTQVNDSDGTLEDRVIECFSQCERMPLTGINNYKGQEELAQLEATVERMLCQVEIQENLLKEDVNFVPLVLERKEVKALPLLVGTLCLSPLMQRKQKKELLSLHGGSIESNNKDVLPSPQKITELTYLSENNVQFMENNEIACSISQLEHSVNRLLNKVEKEEEKIFLTSPSPDPRMYSSSTTDISSEDDSYRGVWWEGAYRSLPRHSCRKRLTKHSLQHKSLKIPNMLSLNNSLNSDDSDTSKESTKCNINKEKSHSKLIVKTVESGKSAVEIRTSSDFTTKTVHDGDSKLCRMFEAHSIWNRSLPSLQTSPPTLGNSFARSLGSDDSINYVKYLEPSECIQYFTPCPTMTLDSTAYCTWAQRRLSEGKIVLKTNN